MRHLLQSLIISFSVFAIASPGFAGDDREDKKWDRDKKEQSRHSKNEKHHHGKKERHSKKERHRKGGLPRCEAELAECTINLTETDALLQVCEDELAQCQATAGQAFPATGQTSCWDSSGALIDCEGTGHDGDIQAGATLAYTDDNGTITDDNTGLMWMKQDDNNLGCGSYPGSLDKDCLFTWDEAFTFVASLNANNYAGHAGWRLPNVKELVSIVNYENFDPVVSDAFNNGCVSGCTLESDSCSCTAAAGYWSSTSAPGGPVIAYIVNFNDGDVGFGFKDDVGVNVRDILRVRAVRGGQ